MSSVTATVPDIISIPEKELASLTGLYVDPITVHSIRLYMRDGKLMLDPNLNTGPGYVLSPLSQNRFKVVGAFYEDSEIVFVRPIAGPMQVKNIFGGKTYTFDAVQNVPSSIQLAEFTGEYVSPELDTTYTLAARDSGLVIQIRGRAEIVLRPIFADAFEGARVGVVKFSRDARGMVTGFTISTGRVRNLRFDRVKR